LPGLGVLFIFFVIASILPRASTLAMGRRIPGLPRRLGLAYRPAGQFSVG
jgi:hypothetical protein